MSLSRAQELQRQDERHRFRIALKMRAPGTGVDGCQGREGDGFGRTLESAEAANSEGNEHCNVRGDRRSYHKPPHPAWRTLDRGNSPLVPVRSHLVVLSRWHQRTALTVNKRLALGLLLVEIGGVPYRSKTSTMGRAPGPPTRTRSPETDVVQPRVLVLPNPCNPALGAGRDLHLAGVLLATLATTRSSPTA